MSKWPEILRYPFNDREWAVKIVMGTVLFIIPVLNILALGYFINCINYGAKNRLEMPDWTNMSRFIKDGCFAFLIVLAYLLVPMVIGIFLFPVPGIGVVLSCIIFLLSGLLVPMAAANYTRYQNLKDAFMLGEIVYLTTQVMNEYLLAYLALVLASALGLAILLVLPFVGIIGGLVMYYSFMVFSTYLGVLHKKAIDT